MYYYKPFANNQLNILNMYNEFILLAVFGTALILSFNTLSPSTVTNIGWFLIALILSSLALTWVSMVPFMFGRTISYFRRCFAREESGLSRRRAKKELAATTAKPDKDKSVNSDTTQARLEQITPEAEEPVKTQMKKRATRRHPLDVVLEGRENMDNY